MFLFPFQLDFHSYLKTAEINWNTLRVSTRRLRYTVLCDLPPFLIKSHLLGGHQIVSNRGTSHVKTSSIASPEKKETHQKTPKNGAPGSFALTWQHRQAAAMCVVQDHQRTAFRRPRKIKRVEESTDASAEVPQLP